MSDERTTTDDRWLTYADAARLLNTTPGAVRAHARRQGWARRSPNAIEGHAWVLVPADRLPANAQAVLAIEHHDRGQRTESEESRVSPAAANGQTAPSNEHDPDGQRTESGDQRTPVQADDQRTDAILSAVQATVEAVTQPLRDQLGTTNQQIELLSTQLGKAHGRADRAEERARAAEDQVRDLQKQLTAEMIEHRRILGLMAEQLAARRSWWPWRRRA